MFIYKKELSYGLPHVFMKIIIIVTLLLLSMHLFASTDPARVESLKIEQSSGKLRVIFDVSKSIKYKAFALKSPDRVVVDFKDTAAAKRVFKFTSNAKSDPINAIRYAVQDNKNLRVVFDMDKTVGVMSRLKKTKKGTRIELTLSNTSIGKKLKYAKKKAPTKKFVKASPYKRGELFTVVIDAGHGGKDPGAIGLNGIYEKNVVLQIAKKLKAQIDKQPGMRAIMTRAGDSFIPLKERVRIASRSRADLFISVHANANMRRSMTGSSVYILSRRGASSEAARFIATRENAAHARTLGSIDFRGRNTMLKTVLLDLTKSSTINRSLALAKNVLKELSSINNLHRGHVESAAFVVLKSLDIPSMLVETAYISNPKEEIQLNQAEYQIKLATAIFRGVKHYYVKHSPKARHYTNSGKKYTVRAGETLLGIANRHKVTLGQLKRVNNLSSSAIRSGQKLKIPVL
jgi:N-acetylmuramoyl-L-alanine amidase